MQCLEKYQCYCDWENERHLLRRVKKEDRILGDVIESYKNWTGGVLIK